MPPKKSDAQETYGPKSQPQNNAQTKAAAAPATLSKAEKRKLNKAKYSAQAEPEQVPSSEKKDELVAAESSSQKSIRTKKSMKNKDKEEDSDADDELINTQVEIKDIDEEPIAHPLLNEIKSHLKNLKPSNSLYRKLNDKQKNILIKLGILVEQLFKELRPNENHNIIHQQFFNLFIEHDHEFLLHRYIKFFHSINTQWLYAKAKSMNPPSSDLIYVGLIYDNRQHGLKEAKEKEDQKTSAQKQFDTIIQFIRMNYPPFNLPAEEAKATRVCQEAYKKVTEFVQKYLQDAQLANLVQYYLRELEFLDIELDYRPHALFTKHTTQVSELLERSLKNSKSPAKNPLANLFQEHQAELKREHAIGRGSEQKDKPIITAESTVPPAKSTQPQPKPANDPAPSRTASPGQR